MLIQSERRGSTPRSKILVEVKTHIFNLIALTNLVRTDRKYYVKLSRNKTPEQHGDKRPSSRNKKPPKIAQIFPSTLFIKGQKTSEVGHSKLQAPYNLHLTHPNPDRDLQIYCNPLMKLIRALTT
jgi:hypothetical protein